MIHLCNVCEFQALPVKGRSVLLSTSPPRLAGCHVGVMVEDGNPMLMIASPQIDTGNPPRNLPCGPWLHLMQVYLLSTASRDLLSSAFSMTTLHNYTHNELQKLIFCSLIQTWQHTCESLGTSLYHSKWMRNSLRFCAPFFSYHLRKISLPVLSFKIVSLTKGIELFQKTN